MYGQAWPPGAPVHLDAPAGFQGFYYRACRVAGDAGGHAVFLWIHGLVSDGGEVLLLQLLRCIPELCLRERAALLQSQQGRLLELIEEQGVLLWGNLPVVQNLRQFRACIHGIRLPSLIMVCFGLTFFACEMCSSAVSKKSIEARQ